MPDTIVDLELRKKLADGTYKIYHPLTKGKNVKLTNGQDVETSLGEITTNGFIGDNSSGTKISANINLINKSGYYITQNTITIDGITDWFLINHIENPLAPKYSLQVASALVNAEKQYMRSQINGAWSQWKKVLNKTDYDQLFQYANDGKTGIANAITAKGVTASPSDTFSALATKIGQIKTTLQVVQPNDIDIQYDSLCCIDDKYLYYYNSNLMNAKMYYHNGILFKKFDSTNSPFKKPVRGISPEGYVSDNNGKYIVCDFNHTVLKATNIDLYTTVNYNGCAINGNYIIGRSTSSGYSVVFDLTAGTLITEWQKAVSNTFYNQNKKVFAINSIDSDGVRCFDIMSKSFVNPLPREGSKLNPLIMYL